MTRRSAKKAKAEPAETKIYISENSPFAGLADFGLAAAPGLAPKPRQKKKLSREWKITIALGILSAALYLLLYEYSGTLTHFAELTRQGEKVDFIIPILVAFVFSLAHGSFTGRFWDALGLKPKKRNQGKEHH